jgi:hypothetical protein
MATKGYFIITDISGYTEYLTKSELEHAHATLQSLFDAQLANIRFPLHISGFRGDAIFIYVPLRINTSFFQKPCSKWYSTPPVLATPAKT